MNPFGMNLLLLAQEASQSTAAQAPAAPATAAQATETAVTAGNDATAATGSALAGWITFLVVLAVLVLPFVVANLIANALKVKEMATRIGISLFALTLFSMPFIQQLVQGESILNAIDLGIDLAGGTNMVLEVDQEQAKALNKDVDSQLMDRMVDAIGRRVNPTGTEEVTVRKVGQDRIEVIVPGADAEKKERIKRNIFDLGQLEFHLLANQNDHGSIIAAGQALAPEKEDVFIGDKKVGMWRNVAIDPETGEPAATYGEYTVGRNVERQGKQRFQMLVAIDPDPNRHITGRLLRRAGETVTDSGLAVSFTFNERGGYLMQQLTARHQPRTGAGYKSRLAILLNNEIYSAPTINAVISSNGVIEGRFTQEEIDSLVSVLNAGALEVPLKPQPVNEFNVSPLLGEDVQRRGFVALLVSVAAVLLVTGAYYLKAGFVADVCLVLNLILLVGAMSIIDATFTLPGLAGVVLTIGMAVDSNVLIFERMREEQAKGSSLRMSIKNGFDKAFSSIFDSNVTTLITAAILYYIGTDQVKGFAVSLFVGICISMFTALYVGRLIFDLAEKKKWLKDLKMMTAIQAVNIDFLSKTRLCVGISALMIAVGLVALAARGRNNLDIDFRGGSMVSFQFREGDQPAGIEEVRAKLTESFQEAIALEQLELVENDQTRNLYRVRTVDADALDVRDKIKAAFADTPYKLILQDVQVGAIQAIASPAEAAAAATASVSDPFAGGFMADVKVEQPMTAVALEEEAREALGTIKVSGQEKYTERDTLISAVPADPQSGATQTGDLKVRFSKVVAQEDAVAALNAMRTKLSGQPHFEELNTFDSAVAGETQLAALNAIFLSLLAIIAYLWLRFQRVSFGLAACVALVHDVAITMGLLALASYLSGNPIGDMLGLTDFKINLPIVAAILTVIGYSLNDTIVVFDRIREVRGRNPALTAQMVNQSLNQTLSRTLLTSVTTLVVLLVLYAIGGEGIHGFSFCLILGILVGTFSSIYVASPILIWLHNRTATRSTGMVAGS